MTEATPRVSVVLPTYRRPAFVGRAVTSVQAQTTTSWELLIVDDNDRESPHRGETEALVTPMAAADGRIRYLRHERNLGGAAARNTGIGAARAPFVAFLDDDDVWAPTKLERQLDCFDRAATDVALVYCRFRVVEIVTGRERPHVTDGRSHAARDLLRRNTIGTTSCVMCRRAALLEVGSFDATLPARQDQDLYLRLADRYRFAFVDETLVTMYVHGGPSISTSIDGSIRANALFGDKYRTRVEADPPARFALLYDLGKLLVAAERYTEARTVLARALRLKPADVEAVTRLAMTYRLPRAFVGPTKRLLALLRGLRG